MKKYLTIKRRYSESRGTLDKDRLFALVILNVKLNDHGTTIPPVYVGSINLIKLGLQSLKINGKE